MEIWEFGEFGVLQGLHVFIYLSIYLILSYPILSYLHSRNVDKMRNLGVDDGGSETELSSSHPKAEETTSS